MQVIVPNKSAPLAHPIELMEKFVAANDWRLHHASATEISVEIPGQWSDYTLNLTWQGKHSQRFPRYFHPRQPDRCCS